MTYLAGRAGEEVFLGAPSHGGDHDLYVGAYPYAKTALSLDDINFPVSEEDLDYLKSIPEKSQLAADIENKKWSPKTTITISKDVDTYDLADDFSPKITINSANNIIKTFINSFPTPLLLSVISSGLTRYWKNENISLNAIKTPKITYNLL